LFGPESGHAADSGELVVWFHSDDAGRSNDVPADYPNTGRATKGICRLKKRSLPQMANENDQ